MHCRLRTSLEDAEREGGNGKGGREEGREKGEGEREK